MTYADYINRFIRGLVVLTESLINGQRPQGEDYMFKRMLRKRFSVTGKWESVYRDNKRVAADYVAMDSSLPLKTRGSIGIASGDIPKIGTERWLNETQLTEIDLLIDTGASDADIAAMLLEDVPTVITAVEELNERAFLEGFSSGIVAISDIDNVGVGVRVDYGYKAENRFGVAVIWNAANAATSTPISDIRRVRNKARQDGNQILHIYMDWTAFDGFAASEQVREFWAAFRGFSGSSIPTPSVEQLNEAFAGDKANRIMIHIVDRAITIQRNGVDEVIYPWATGMCILTDREEVGSLVWARLAEDRHRAADVTYETANDYTLVSIKRHTDPSLSEHTKAQARVIPVITNVNAIYQLDSTTVQG